MNMRVCATALIVLAGGTRAFADGSEPATQQPEKTLAAAAPVAAPAPAPAPTPAPAAAQPDDKGAPPVVVHKDQTAADTRDARVDYGGVRISMGWGFPGGGPAGAHGTIQVPSNTLGPGLALWRADDMQDADRKLATAAADIAKTEAERPNTYDRYDSGYGPYGVFNWFGGGYGGFGGGYGGYAPAPFVQMRGGPGGPGPGGPPAGVRHATESITPSNSIGSAAQQAFAASYPRLGPTQNARDAAMREITKNAMPQIAQTQNAVDEAHTIASTEHPAH